MGSPELGSIPATVRLRDVAAAAGDLRLPLDDHEEFPSACPLLTEHGASGYVEVVAESRQVGQLLSGKSLEKR
jgi:hypothetical protein